MGTPAANAPVTEEHLAGDGAEERAAASGDEVDWAAEDVGPPVEEPKAGAVDPALPDDPLGLGVSAPVTAREGGRGGSRGDADGDAGQSDASSDSQAQPWRRRSPRHADSRGGLANGGAGPAAAGTAPQGMGRGRGLTGSPLNPAGPLRARPRRLAAVPLSRVLAAHPTLGNIRGGQLLRLTTGRGAFHQFVNVQPLMRVAAGRTLGGTLTAARPMMVRTPLRLRGPFPVAARRLATLGAGLSVTGGPLIPVLPRQAAAAAAARGLQEALQRRLLLRQNALGVAAPRANLPAMQRRTPLRPLAFGTTAAALAARVKGRGKGKVAPLLSMPSPCLGRGAPARLLNLRVPLRNPQVRSGVLAAAAAVPENRQTAGASRVPTFSASKGLHAGAAGMDNGRGALQVNRSSEEQAANEKANGEARRKVVSLRPRSAGDERGGVDPRLESRPADRGAREDHRNHRGRGSSSRGASRESWVHETGRGRSNWEGDRGGGGSDRGVDRGSGRVGDRAGKKEDKRWAEPSTGADRASGSSLRWRGEKFESSSGTHGGHGHKSDRGRGERDSRREPCSRGRDWNDKDRGYDDHGHHLAKRPRR